MKKLLLSIIGGFSSTLLCAQITVDHTHIATLGDTVFMSEDTLNASSLNLGTAAGGQTWDFTGLVEHDPDGAILEAPSTAPLSSNYPNADFVVNDLTEDSIHIFFKLTNSALDVVGVVEYDSLGNPTPGFLGLEWRFMEFPSTFGDSWLSSGFGEEQTSYLGIDPDSLGPHPTIDSLRQKIYFGFNNEIDAWGDLKLPQGDFLSIRQRVETVLEAKLDWYGNGMWQPISASFFLSAVIDSVLYDTGDVTYRWWGNNAAANFFIAEVEVDSLENPQGDVSFLKGAPIPPAGLSHLDASIEVYPNPATSFIHVRSDRYPAFSVKMIDIQAREVLNTSSSSGSLNIDVNDMAAGSYLLQVMNTEGRTIRMEKMQIAE